MSKTRIVWEVAFATRHSDVVADRVHVTAGSIETAVKKAHATLKKQGFRGLRAISAQQHCRIDG